MDDEPMSESIALSRNVDLVYSPDDAERYGTGYYLQRYPSGETSQLFATRAEAERAFAMRNHPGAINWQA